MTVRLRIDLNTQTWEYLNKQSPAKNRSYAIWVLSDLSCDYDTIIEERRKAFQKGIKKSAMKRFFHETLPGAMFLRFDEKRR